MSKTEIWKDIEGYDGIYQVSNLGRVRSLDRYVPAVCALSKSREVVNYLRKGRIIKPHYGGYFGYLYVNLSIGDKPKNFSIHRLVAKAFIPNPDKLPEVNHKDEDKTNNRADNLEWCTRKQNENYGNKIERGAKNRKRKSVVAYNESNEVVARFDRISDAAKVYGVSISTIWQVCNHIRNCKTAAGLYWIYIDE